MTCKNPHFSGNLLSFLNLNHYSLPSIAWTLAVHFIKQHLARLKKKSGLLEQRRVLRLQGLAVQRSSADSKMMHLTHLMRLCKKMLSTWPIRVVWYGEQVRTWEVVVEMNCWLTIGPLGDVMLQMGTWIKVTTWNFASAT